MVVNLIPTRSASFMLIAGYRHKPSVEETC